VLSIAHSIPLCHAMAAAETLHPAPLRVTAWRPLAA